MSEAVDFQEVQEFFGFQESAPVEKDWHVIRAMRAIAAVDASPFRLVFAGGTCLARAYRLTSRMSEDVDFKVEHIGEKPLSANQLRKQLGELRARIATALQDADFSLDASQIKSRDGNRYTVFELPYGDRANAAGILRPNIQIELNCVNLRRPTVTLPVASFVAEASGQAPEIESIACVDVTETAAEKLVSLTRRTAMEMAGASRAEDSNLVRHIYDLHQIRSLIDPTVFGELARSIAADDAEEFAAQFPAYRTDIPGETRAALTFLQNESGVRRRYDIFQTRMVYGSPTKFELAFGTVQQLARDVWP